MLEADFSKPNSPGKLEPTTFRERRPGQAAREVKGLGYVPDPLPAGLRRNDVVIEVHDLLVEAEQNLSQLEGLARRMRDPKLLMGPLARKEAMASSAIENTFASEEQLALFSIDATAVETELRPEVQEVTNYLAALRYGFNDQRPICLNLIKEMHALLLKDSTRAAGHPGEFRTRQNAIGDETAPFTDAKFVPPPPRFLDKCLADLETYMNTADDMPRLVRFALAHYQFECIHPFDDGNGRLGRLLVALQLSKQGQLRLPFVYVSGFFEKKREMYYQLLRRVSSEGAWMDWIKFFLAAIVMQARDTGMRVERLDQLHSEYHNKVRQKRASAMLPKLVDSLFLNPAITVAGAAKTAGMRPASAGKLVGQLEKFGIVREATGRKHYRIFVADGIIEAMTAEFRQDELVEQPQSPPQTPPAEAS